MRIELAALAGAALLFSGSVAAQEHPDLSGYWGPVFEQGEPDPVLVAELPDGTALLDDVGAKEFKAGEFGGLKPKPEALAKAEAWDPLDDMTLARVCHAPGTIYGMQGPFPFEIFQGRDMIVIKLEYFDQVRIVFMDGRDWPAPDAPHSTVGFSLGHWDGDQLVVETSHLSASTITNNGLDHSDNVKLVERFRLSEDGQSLYQSQWFSDPETLENDGARVIRWQKGGADAHVYPYECDPTFALEYAAMQEGADGE